MSSLKPCDSHSKKSAASAQLIPSRIAAQLHLNIVVGPAIISYSEASIPNSKPMTGDVSEMPKVFRNITKLARGPYIRLLYLHPRRKYTDALETGLKVVPIAGPPAFEALSYVWGSKTTSGQNPGERNSRRQGLGKSRRRSPPPPLP